ncbi:hypothetical protein AB0L80_38670 [Streptomyces sp. NPDC052069]|uniref:hypothetical protein n=1 Tax=Streptomyces sp. NPDC052069 TaxID=3154650 RepID=UPI0034215C3F
MTAAIIAVLGTLAGALLTGALQHTAQRSQRAAAEAATRRAEALDAVTALVTALADHRRTMWVREDLRLRGQDWATARAESHTTRAAITAPLMRLAILLPTLTPAAQTAVTATCALRAAPDDTTLQTARQHAIRTADALVTAAATAVGTLHHTTRRAQRDATETTRRTAALTAVTELTAALADHRRTMVTREGQRLRREDWTAARAASHTTRSAITAPLLRVSVLAPALAPAAQTAATATYALRHTPTDTTLHAAQEHAIRAADDLVAAAGSALTP